MIAIESAVGCGRRDALGIVGRWTSLSSGRRRRLRPDSAPGRVRGSVGDAPRGGPDLRSSVPEPADYDDWAALGNPVVGNCSMGPGSRRLAEEIGSSR
jgi:hypothetical protein